MDYYTREEAHVGRAFLAHTHTPQPRETVGFQPAGTNINADLLSPQRYTVQLLTKYSLFSRYIYRDVCI